MQEREPRLEEQSKGDAGKPKGKEERTELKTHTQITVVVIL